MSWFFREGDASYYRATALDPFGTGHAFTRAGFAHEIAYRYGRIGFPILAWVFALGQPAFVPWSLIVLQLAATAAVPGLACVLAEEYGAPPLAGAAVLLSPMLFLLGIVFAEPLLIALVLLAYILEARRLQRSALVVFALAVLVKETAILALIPFIWQALWRRDFKGAFVHVATLIPYAAWCVLLRIRVGEFPFLARTVSRTNAVAFPGRALRYVISHRTPDHNAVVAMVLATIALCLVGCVVSRDMPIGGFAAALAILVACLGDNALRYSEETLRLLILPQVIGLLCIAVAATRAWESRFGKPLGRGRRSGEWRSTRWD